MHGKGKLTFSDGSVYEGQFARHNLNGNGTMRYSDGYRYEGQWKEGRRHGQGTMFHSDGTQDGGEWMTDGLLLDDSTFGSLFCRDDEDAD